MSVEFPVSTFTHKMTKKSIVTFEVNVNYSVYIVQREVFDVQDGKKNCLEF
jgi:hypothetical protein